MPQSLIGLPDAPRTDAGGAPLAVVTLTGASAGAPLATVSTVPGSSLATSGTIAPTITPTTVTGTVPSTVGEVSSASLPGYPAYTPAVDPTDPQPGEFVRDGTTVTVQLRDNEAPASGSQLSYRGVNAVRTVAKTVRKTDAVPVLYGTWNIVEASFSRNFEGHPSGSVKFYVQSSQRYAVQQLLENSTRITLYGIGYEVVAAEFTEAKPSVEQSGWTEVTLSLQCWHSWRMSQPVKIGDALPGTQGQKRYIPLGNIGAHWGVNYLGAPIYVYYPPDTPNSATTTMQSALDEYKRTVNGFSFLSNATAAEIRTLGETPVHVLSDADIISDIQWNYGGREMRYQGIQLTEIYKNTVMTLDDRQGDSSSEAPASGGGLRTICTPKDNPSIAPRVPHLRDVGTVFDNGGITKTRSCKKYIGETIIEEDFVKYGFAYRLIDVYYLATVVVGSTTQLQWIYDDSIDPAAFWIPVEVTKKTYHYNSYGYLTDVTETGTRTVRLKSEKQQETLDLGKARDGTSGAEYNKLTDRINAYAFSIVQPTDKTTNYDLAPLAALYSDIQQKTDDPQWIPPYYCQVEATSQIDSITAEDPDATDTNPKPPVTTGKVYNQNKSVSIISTVPNREMFLQNQSTQNSEGTNFKNALIISQAQENKGRPPVHTRGQVELISGVNYVDPNAPNNIPDTSQTKYILNPTGSTYPATEAERGSFTAPSPYPDVVRLAAECDLAVKNLQSETADFKINYDPVWQEGDRVLWRAVYWIVLGVSWTEKAESPGVLTCEGMTLKLGRYLRIPVNATAYPSGR